MQGLGQLTLVNNNKQSVLFHVGQVWRHAPRLGHAPYMETHTRWGSDQCSSFTTAKCTFRAEVDSALKPGTAVTIHARKISGCDLPLQVKYLHCDLIIVSIVTYYCPGHRCLAVQGDTRG